MTKKQGNNYAFIDGQNLYFGIKDFGWDFDYKRLIIHLRETYGVSKILLFLGYVEENKKLYTHLTNFGYKIIFKEVSKGKDGKIKGNVDILMAMHIILSYGDYEKAVIITSDGDFAPLIEHLESSNKLRAVLSPQRKTCSWLIRKYAKGRLDYLANVREVLEMKKRP